MKQNCWRKGPYAAFSALLLAGACGPNPQALVSTGRLGTARPISKDRELMIRDLSVVEDPARTLEPCDGPGSGDLPPWSFGRLMSQVAEQAGASDPAEFTLSWLQSWDSEQTVNGYLVPRRERMRPIITDPWLEASGGSRLDLSQAPFRLAAIVNRMDLRGSDGETPIDAGEARFVFNAVNAHTCARIDFTVILEFKLIASSQQDVLDWANRWHALGDLGFGPRFNQALQSITDDFTQSFSQLRTNEQAISFVEWEERTFEAPFRELQLSPLRNTPDGSFQGSSELASYVNQHAEEILNQRHQVPTQMIGGWIQESFFWDSLEIEDRLEVRHQFGLQTCNGCHAAETGTNFVHVSPRRNHEIADLSDYLTGEHMPTTDALGQRRTFNELQRRADLLQGLLDRGFFPMPRTNRIH